MKTPFDVPPRMKAEGMGFGVWDVAVEYLFNGTRRCMTVCGVRMVHLIWLDGS
jgi:hypothetical protein